MSENVKAIVRRQVFAYLNNLAKSHHETNPKPRRGAQQTPELSFTNLEGKLSDAFGISNAEALKLIEEYNRE